jgi:hypothetical protein
MTLIQFTNILSYLAEYIFFPVVVGFVLWRIGISTEKKKIKAEAIRDLMTYRGDLASPEFRRSLNKVSIIFHDKEKVRNEVRNLYQVINNPTSNAEHTKRTIVGLIYMLCKHNGFKGLSEYDIDQSFAEKNQSPDQENPGIITTEILTSKK